VTIHNHWRSPFPPAAVSYLGHPNHKELECSTWPFSSSAGVTAWPRHVSSPQKSDNTFSVARASDAESQICPSFFRFPRNSSIMPKQ